MKRTVFTILVLTMWTWGGYAQSHTIEGKVTDSNQQPLIGVTVQAKGFSIGTQTDFDGNYSLELRGNQKDEIKTLIFSYVGFKSQSIDIKGRTTINVQLQEDVDELEEVVVIGYGAKAKKQDLSSAVGILKNTEDLNVRPIASATSMLQGQLAGVTVQANGGSPTSTPSLVIRGQGSKNGDGVLWVVDGVPGAPIASLNDIESIVVLKDAASAAIYGAQSGAGGVVLVTTKKAKSGKLSVSYEGNFGFRKAANLPTPLNAEQQLKMRHLSYKNAGIPIPDAWDPNKNPWIKTTRTDWMDEIFRSAPYKRHNIALNGGTENFSNRLSFSSEDNQGVLENTYNKNLAIRYNSTYNINKYISLSEELVWTTGQSRSVGTSSEYSGAILSAIYMPSSATVYNPLDGTFGGTTTEDPEYIKKYGSNFAGAHGDAINPMRSLLAQNIFARSNRIWTSTSLNIKNIIQGLKFTSRFSYDLNSNYGKFFTPKTDEPGKPDLNNFLNVSSNRANSWKTENTFTYDRKFDGHNIGVLLSTTADHYVGRGFSVQGKDFEDETSYLQYLKYAGKTSAEDYLSGPDANVSLVSRVSYSYDDRYFATASFRRDYAGRLPKENNYGDFPAATFGWKISNESFFPKTELINLLKFRASWGRVGNLGSIGKNYKSSLMGSSFWDEQAVYGVANNALYNNFIYNNKALNKNLTWETSEQTDFGLDLIMFNERLNVSFDYFNKRTFNLIQEQTINWSETIGLEPMLINQGEVKNTGFELEATWSNRVNDDFSYFARGNFSYLNNRVTDIGVKNEDGEPGVWTGGGKIRNIAYVYQTAQGEPLNSFYLIKTDGIFQTDAEAAAYVDKSGNRIQPNAKAGDLKFVDANGDGKINDSDRQYMGSATPKATYALTLGTTYKKLSVSAMLQGVSGSKIFFGAKYMLLSDVEGSFNRDSRILDAWSPSNTSSNIPRLSKNDPNSNISTASDWYLEDGSFMRLKNLTVSYDFTDLLQKWSHTKERGSRLSLYLSGENLVTLTKYTGIDPEVGGYDTMKYPISRIFSFGIKLTY